jgi:hypothetical protein
MKFPIFGGPRAGNMCEQSKCRIGPSGSNVCLRSVELAFRSFVGINNSESPDKDSDCGDAYCTAPHPNSNKNREFQEARFALLCVLLHKARPILGCLCDVSFEVLIKHVIYIRVQSEIQLVVMDLPRGDVHWEQRSD